MTEENKSSIFPKKIILLIFFTIITYAFGCGSNGEQKQKFVIFENKIGIEKLDSTSIDSFITANPDFIEYRRKMVKFYQRRGFNLAWSKEGEFLPQADMFINIVHNLHQEGITANDSSDLNLREAYINLTDDNIYKREESVQKRKQLDISLTASYFKYARQLWGGTIDPAGDKMEWYVEKKKIKYGKTLDSILTSNGMENPFTKYESHNPHYIKLKNALMAYKEIEQKGGWEEVITDNRKLAKGDTSMAVFALKKRLVVSGDLKTLTTNTLFDLDVENALKTFQRRHGLKENGVLDGYTLRVLNVPVSDRIKQIIINMERWRWVPETQNPNYLMVNIPEYKLHVYENKKEVWNMNVIVGKAATSTPIFNDEIEFIVFSPHWNVPQSIVKDELIPLLRKNPAIVDYENLEVYIGNDPKNLQDPYLINWNEVDPVHNEYKFRQRPGRANALGNVKFLFPNSFDVYLHDTPTGYLFTQSDRGFSHGCIRIEEPEKLARYLLKDDLAWDEAKIHEAMNKGEEKYVKLKNKLPVYIVYFTAWVDDSGTINFRNDIYKHDQRLEQIYFEKEIN